VEAIVPILAVVISVVAVGFVLAQVFQVSAKVFFAGLYWTLDVAIRVLLLVYLAYWVVVTIHLHSELAKAKKDAESQKLKDK
jgi:uncharacterized membrane protein